MSDTFPLPIRLAPDERRAFAQRLAERLGTKSAGGLSIVCDEVPAEGDLSAGGTPATPPGVLVRWKVGGDAGGVKVRGLQQLAGEALPGGRYRLTQRDALGIGGLEGGAAILLSVEEPFDLVEAPSNAREHPAARAPAAVKVEIRDGTPEAREKTRDEVFRTAGEKVAPLLARGEISLIEVPFGISIPDAKPALRGRWAQVPAPIPTDGGRLFGRLACVEDPRAASKGRMILIRESFSVIPDRADAFAKALASGDATGARLACRRAIAPLCAIPPGAKLILESNEHGEKKLDRRAIEKALAALAWEAAGTAPADPRPLPRKLASTAAQAETIAIDLGLARRLDGEARDLAPGAGARMGGVDLSVFDGKGIRQGTLCERVLTGLPGDGFAALAAFERSTALLLVVPPVKRSERWIERLLAAL